MSVQIRAFVKEDAVQVARLHRIAIPRGFLSELGDGFLVRLYREIARAEGSCVLVAADGDDVCLGFVAGSIDIRICYRRILLRGGITLFLQILPSLFRASVLKRILQTLLYPLRRGKGNDEMGAVLAEDAGAKAELLSIAVDEKARGLGVGRLLVEALEVFFRRQGGQTAYGLITDATDPRSNAFYEALGFRLKAKFRHHEHDMNQYVKALTDGSLESAKV